jgi:hypothetical protein
MYARVCHFLTKLFFLFGLLQSLVSCTLVEERIDHAAGILNVPADTDVHMQPGLIEQPEERKPRTISSGPLQITITESILLCLENNRTLVVERLNPSIQKTFEDQERSVFDPETSSEIIAARQKEERLARSGSDTEGSTSDMAEAMISLEQFFPTGTTVALEGSSRVTDSSLYESSFYSWAR